MRVIVVGAGVVGATVACRLARGGAAVTIFERGRAGRGTSASSFAWTNANNKTPRAYHDLNVAGMRSHAALREEFGGAAWWHGGGNVAWAATDESRRELRERLERLRAWDYAAEEIPAGRLRELEPDIPPQAVRGAMIAYFPDEGWVETSAYVHAMIEAAVSAGASYRPETDARALRRTGDRVTGVLTADGRPHDADVVMNCAGRWGDELAATAGLRLPLAPTRGLLVVSPPAPQRLSRIVHAPGCHLRPDGGGRVMVQADDTDEAVTHAEAEVPREDLVAGLMERAGRLLPGLAGLRAESARVGVRVMPADGHSIVGPHRGVAGYYVAVTHSGVTLAPYLGVAAAAEILDGRPDGRLAPFRPDRFP